LRRSVIVALVAAVVGGAVVLRSRELFEPWSGLHKAWGGAMYGNIARNLLRYDAAETGFAPLTNTGPVVDRADFEYYYHYPPLLVSMVAASFRVFGEHEGSARLVPLAFSLLTMALVFAFARRFWDGRIAVSALILVSFLPVELYYADHVDVYGPPAAFLAALAVYGYARWYQDRRGSSLALSLVALTLGCLTAWYAYFVVPLIAAHARFVAPRDRRPSFGVLAAFGTSAVAVFVGFLLHRWLLIGGGGSEVAGSLVQKLLIRTAWTHLAIPTTEGLIPVSLWQFGTHLARDGVRMHGPLVLALVATWFVTLARRTRHRQLQDRDWFLLILLGYGALHSLAFPMLLPGHDFLSRCFTPAFAVGGAVALNALGDRVRQSWGPRAGTGVIGAVLALSVLSGAALGRRISPGGSGERTALWGTFVREATTPETLVLVMGPEDRVFQYYLDRRVRWEIETPTDLLSTAGPDSPRVFLLSEQEANRYPDLATALTAGNRYVSWRGLRVYRPASLENSP